MIMKNVSWLVGAVCALLFAGSVASFTLMNALNAHAASLPQITSSLAIGSSGQNVMTLQTLLATSHNVYPAGLVTGYYGPLTATAVAQFQIANGLPAVGRVGPLTLAKLNALIANGNTSIDVDAPIISDVQTIPSSTGVTITWNTNEMALGKVHWDSIPITMFETSTAQVEPQTSGSVITEQVSGTSHSIVIGGLNPGQTYYYSIESSDPSQNVSVTLPSAFVTP